MTAEDPLTAEAAEDAARAFVLDEAGFAQLTTLDAKGFPVARTMTAFLDPDWSVALVQRRSHARLVQLRRDPHVLVAWVGDPAPGASNDNPHVFDIGRLPPRAVFLRGTATFMPEEWTIARYQREVAAQRARGATKAPLRTPEEVVADLMGVHVRPHRLRLEGFGQGAQSFDRVLEPTDRTPMGAP